VFGLRRWGSATPPPTSELIDAADDFVDLAEHEETFLL